MEKSTEAIMYYISVSIRMKSAFWYNSEQLFKVHTELEALLTVLIPGRFNIGPMTGTRRKKLTATGKKPLQNNHNKLAFMIPYLDILLIENQIMHVGWMLRMISINVWSADTHGTHSHSILQNSYNAAVCRTDSILKCPAMQSLKWTLLCGTLDL